MSLSHDFFAAVSFPKVPEPWCAPHLDIGGATGRLAQPSGDVLPVTEGFLSRERGKRWRRPRRTTDRGSCSRLDHHLGVEYAFRSDREVREEGSDPQPRALSRVATDTARQQIDVADAVRRLGTFARTTRPVVRAFGLRTPRPGGSMGFISGDWPRPFLRSAR